MIILFKIINLKRKEFHNKIITLSENQFRRIFENQEDELIGYHGTSVDFDKFDLSFSKSGEGSNFYGYGVYVTEDENTVNFMHMSIIKQGKL